MKNSINIFALVLFNLTVFAQSYTRIDTLRFTSDSSYARAIVRFGDALVFGTSKTGVISFDEKTGTRTTLLPANTAGEFRDLVVHEKKLYAITSGDNGLLFEYTAEKTSMFYYEMGAFYDDLASNKRQMVLLGDPIDKRFYLRKWDWKKSDSPICGTVVNKPEEACYAASGTTAQFLTNGDYCFVSGGKNAARFHRFSWKNPSAVLSVDLPLTNGEGAGPFSVFFWDQQHGVVVGGNYTLPEERAGTAAFTIDGGKTWTASSTGTLGYRSCVTGTKYLLYACGTTGIDYSTDGGTTWTSFLKGNFYALLLEKNVLYATTNKGMCLKILW